MRKSIDHISMSLPVHAHSAHIAPTHMTQTRSQTDRKVNEKGDTTYIFRTYHTFIILLQYTRVEP